MTGEMSDALQKILMTGDTSPQSMTNLVDVALFGKTAEATTSTSENSTTSSDSDESGKSQQIAGNPFERMAPGEYVQPKYNPDVWAAAMDQNTRLGRSIRTFARNTVGLGWYIEPIHKITPKTPKEEQEIVAEETKILHKLFERPNEEMPITQLFYLEKVDEEATGDGYIEVTRNNAGKIGNLFHAPTITMRIRVRKVSDNVKVGGYVQIRGNEKRYFKEFGDKGVMNAKTGQYYEGDSPLPPSERATEIIHFRVYSPTSTWYGAPRYVSAAPAISGNRLAAIRNVNFFDNDAPQPIDTPVLTPSGWRKMGDLKPGDFVIGVDGKPHKILNVYKQGVQKVYRVTFNDDSSTECTLNHVWSVSNEYDRIRNTSRLMTLEQIMADGFKSAPKTFKWSVPLCAPVEYEKGKPLPIDPYLMGLLLGDGSFRVGKKGSISLSAGKEDIEWTQEELSRVVPNGIDAVLRIRKAHGFPGSQDGHGLFHFSKVSRKRGPTFPNTMKLDIQELGLLHVIGGDKFIPETYLRASVKDRISLLQGLIDSDGCVSDTAVRFVSISKRLATDVVNLVGSLGGVATLKPQKGRTTYQVTIRKRFPDGINPARMPRKALKYGSRREMPRIRTMVGAEFSREVETQCIKVDSSDGLYVTENFIVTHNTPRMAVLVSGGRLDPLSMQQIEDFIKAKTSGVQNAHKVMVLQAEGQKVGFQQQAPVTKIDLQPLTVGVTEDSSFNTYREANDEEIREAFGIARIFYSADDVNKSCLTLETRIPLIDGRTMTLGDLTKEYGTNGTFLVFSKDKNGNVVPGKAHSPRKTKENTEIWEVLLDNNETVRGTPDHLFMLIDGNYKELSKLEPGDRLSPLYRTIKPMANDYSISCYHFYSTTGMPKKEPVHRMVGRFILGMEIPDGYQVHHLGNTLNNNPDNLQILKHGTHATENLTKRWEGTSFEERRKNMDAALAATTFNIPIEDIKAAAKPGMSWGQLGEVFNCHPDTLVKKVEASGLTSTQFRDTYMPHIDGLGTQKRFDVTLDSILQIAPECKSIQQVAKALGVSTTFVYDELKRNDWTWKKVKSEILGINIGTGENHRVIQVRRCGVADVYDITVEEHHNFALHAGVFVHNSAEISRALTNEQEFEPDRLEKEYIINQKIVCDLLKSHRSKDAETSEDDYTPHVRFRFERMKLTDPLDTAQLNQAYAQMGALTPNELREAIGKPPYPDEYAFANKPLQVAMQELSAGLAMAIVGEKRDAIPGGDQGQGGMPGDVPPGAEQGGEQGIAPGQMQSGEEQRQPGAEGAENQEGQESGTVGSEPVSPMPPQEEAKSGGGENTVYIGKSIGDVRGLPPMSTQARVLALQGLLADVQSFAQTARLPYLFNRPEEGGKVVKKKV
jgi:capsid portal protein